MLATPEDEMAGTIPFISLTDAVVAAIGSHGAVERATLLLKLS
jgi:hypothetical protein